MEACHHCGREIDPQRHRYKLQWQDVPERLLSVPSLSERIDRTYTVRCPECCNTYVSTTLRRFGFLTRGGYMAFLGAIVLVGIAVSVLA